MKVYYNTERSQWKELLKRPQMDSSLINPRVAVILEIVKNDGDDALRRFSREFDEVEVDALMVSEEEIEAASKLIEPKLKNAIKKAIENIEKFHSAQSYDGIEVEISAGVKCYQKSVPIQKVGLYVPGGSAPLFSSVLMLGIPARIAGCKEVIICTPPDKNGGIAPTILYAAKKCGISKIFKVGGAQAIGAMAYGTESVPKVDKIFGPGNQYVTAAKQQVGMSDVAIDMPAGPSEVLIMADDSANPAFVAADLLSQAEHGGDSQAILITTSGQLAEKVKKEVEAQTEHLSRAAIAERSKGNSRILVLENADEMVELANEYAAEHLIIAMNDAWSAADKIVAAGSVFIGNYTPESAGDYASGTNHTLPTNGWAKAYSGVNLDSFNRKITFQEITREGIEDLGPAIEAMAMAEGLDAHANAVRVRLNEGKND